MEAKLDEMMQEIRQSRKEVEATKKELEDKYLLLHDRAEA